MEVERLTERQSEATNQFIEFWAEMATHWGINRTMAQIHALLYVTEGPLDTEMIMSRLGISRGNANMNLHSLLRWELVMKEPVSGSRRDHFVAEKDVWTIMAQIIKNRQQQEVAPIVDKLDGFSEMFNSSDVERTAGENVFLQRIENLSELMTVFQNVTESLIPFVQKENMALIQQLVQFAESMKATLSRPSDNR
ncbi:MAG: hypothetical protein HKN43_03750 [Rhodothermales bacterium]|nr:hypothetical protein [Rhodothermales bacterium]